MTKDTMNKFMNLVSEANRPVPAGGSEDEHGDKTFDEFATGIRAIIADGDVEAKLLSLIGTALEMQYKGARSQHIRVGMLNLMIEMADYCFADEKDPVILEKVKERRTEWLKNIEEVKATQEKLKTLSPDDILKAPVLADLPNN